jgi:hypothetical protein
MWKQRGVKEPSQTPPGEKRIASPIPAPGGLAEVQAFLNTVKRTKKKTTDELATPRDLSDWLSRRGLLPAGTRLTPSDLERARDTRDGLRALLLAHNGYDLDEEAVARLDRAAVGARAQVRFDRDGTSRLERVSRDFDDALGTLLGFVHAAQSAGIWPRFKACASAECRAAFYDFSKGRLGKWCTTRCGDKIRARAFRKTDKYRG